MHGVPAGLKFGRQVPDPSQVSGFEQLVLLGSPQAVPAAASLLLQWPLPSQVSGAVQALLVGSPQVAVFGWKESAGQVGFTPSQDSAKSHTPAAGRQLPPAGSMPWQLSAASSHDSAQFVSPSGPGQGLPACVPHE